MLILLSLFLGHARYLPKNLAPSCTIDVYHSVQNSRGIWLGLEIAILFLRRLVIAKCYFK